jgi:glucan phosphoethanolaminetransferase (alkaline phosphatase superfamily)
VTEDLPDPARLAAIDQQLAEMADRLDRNARSMMRADVALAIVAVALAVAVLVGHPRVFRWELAVVLLALAAAAVTGFVQGLMLRSYRAEVRELRARSGATGALREDG